MTLSTSDWHMIWPWLRAKYGKPVEDSVYVPPALASAFAKIIRAELDPELIPAFPCMSHERLERLAKFMDGWWFIVREQADTVLLDDECPIISGPPLPEKSSWRYRQELDALERDRDTRRSGIRSTPNGGLDALLELPPWRGAKEAGGPTGEDLDHVRREITQAKRRLAQESSWYHTGAALEVEETQARLFRISKPGCRRFLHPSGAVLLVYPK